MIKHIFTAIFILVTQQVFAHYIWIEAQPEGKTGEKQTAKIYYGEYENNLHEVAGKRLDEVNGLEAWVVNYSGEKIKSILTKKDNHYALEFTCETPGKYDILVMNNVREVVDWTAYDIGIVKPVYYSRKTFFAYDPAIKRSQDFVHERSYHQLDIIPVYNIAPAHNYFKLGHFISLDAFYKGSTLPKGKLMVYAPNGWMKEIERGDDGLFSFTPLEGGQYVIECVYKEKISGSYHDKNYEAIRHRAILTIEVK